MRESAIAPIVAVLVACSSSDGSTPSERGSALPRTEETLARTVATCAQVDGGGELRRKGSVRWEKLDVGATLREGDWVRTGANAHARLRFASGFLDLDERTAILVDQAISIESGTVVGFADSKQSFAIRAADGSTATVRGAGDQAAEFRLMPSPASGVEIAATKAPLEVSADGATRSIGAGEATDVAQHRASPIVKLLGFPRSVSPGVDARFLFERGMTIPLAWAEVAGGARYHVQVARDTDFHALVVSTDADTTKHAFRPDAEGTYMWRVAARDASGRLGEYGFARRIYCEADRPEDLLVAPADGQRVGFSGDPPRVTFSWRPVGDAKQYKLVVERVPSGEAVVTMTTAAQRLVATLDEGTYRWGVFAVRASDEAPIFLKMRRLAIRKQPGPSVRVQVDFSGSP